MFVFAGIFFLTLLILSQVYQDEIIDAVVTEVNKSLKEPIEVDQVSFSAIRNFPQVGVTLEGLIVPPGAGDVSEPLLKAGRVAVLFNLWDMLRGEYRITSVSIENGELNLRVLANGDVNYDVVRAEPATEDETTDEEGGSLSLDLESVVLEQMLVRYADASSEQEYLLYAEDTKATLSIADILYSIGLEGDLQCRGIRLGDEVYLREKPISLKTALTYNDSTGAVEILPSELLVRGSAFKVRGKYTPGKPDRVDISVSADETNLATLVSLLPEELEKDLAPYRSRGQMYFSGTIAGGVSGGATPRIDFNFGGQDVSFSHPDFNQTLDHAFFEGQFSNGSKGTLATTSLTLKNVKGDLNGKPLRGELTLSNFDDYTLAFALAGQMDVPSILAVADLEAVEEGSGYLDFDVNFRGRLADLEQANTINRIRTSGTLGVRDLNVTLADWPIPMSGISGTFQFNSTDLAIKNVQGQIGQSHLRFNGILNNLVGWLLLDDQDFVVQADLYSDNLDLDELLSGEALDEDEANEVQEEGEYSFYLPKGWELDFNARINRLKFRRLRANQVTGNISLNNQVAKVSDFSLRSMGGRVQANATMDGRDSLKVPVDVKMRLERLDIDSIFYTLENFDQDYLTHENLKGQLFADVDALLPFDRALELDMNAMIADISMSVKNGELNDFETMQELSRFIEEEELANLRFSEMNNDLRIEQGKLFIPLMEINSNIANIGMRGIQSFEDDIDYRLRISLQEFKRRDRDERFGVVEDDGTGIQNVFIRVFGTIYDYEISYDSEAARAYRRERRREDGFKFRDLFQQNSEEPKQQELNEEEFFEWEGEGGQ